MTTHDRPIQGSSPRLGRRKFLVSASASAAGMLGTSYFGTAAQGLASETQSGATEIGSRRELFVDRSLVESLGGDAQLQLHHPAPQDIVLKHDQPWEGTGSGYHSVFQDGDRYRMYYKAWHLDVGENAPLNTDRHPLFCCYAESADGIHWEKPELGLHDFQGSRDNNIVIVSGKRGPLNVDAGHPAVFKDDNPNAAPDAKYKAILRSKKPIGLLPFKSPDGFNWSPMTTEPVLGEHGAFDSQNLAFWDPTISKYRGYWRSFSGGVINDEVWKPQGVRSIRTATSDDLIHWSKPADLTYVDSPEEQLYTNVIKPYARAPHLLLGFPTRYVERGWSESMKQLPNREGRELRSAASDRYGMALTEGLVMASRDGAHFHRWNEAFLPPGIERPGTWHYGHQYIGWHLVETRSAFAGAPNELSLYATESYWHGEGSDLRRYTLRLDGFVSVRAPHSGGELLTKPVVFDGQSLEINFSSSAVGSIRVELQTPTSEPIAGFTLNDCDELFGDSVDRHVTWKGKSAVGQLAGQPVQLRFALRDADLYSYRFRGEA